jgi:SAM-dependent methyltransferase
MLSEDIGAIYSSKFFVGQEGGSANSAAIVVPLVLSLLDIKSVVDVGCGVATWAAEFIANGVPDVWGIDGDYVDRSQLRISLDRFIACDLTESIPVERNFDLAVCLEVAEHLPESRAGGLVASLASLAPCVLFSAAVPGQGGTHHVNEQYLAYWVKLFERHGYQGLDTIRPSILGNDLVEWFYQQNIVMFVAPEHPLHDKHIPHPFPIIHQYLYERRARQLKLPLGTLARALPGALVRSVRYHLGLH